MQTDPIEQADKLTISPHDKVKWAELIAQWENGHERQKAFCARLGLNHNTFTYWRGIFLAKNRQAKNKTKFIPIAIKEEKSNTVFNLDKLILENSNGFKLHIPLSISRDQLKDLLRSVGWSHA